MSWRRVILAVTVGTALSGAAPCRADAPSNAELLERIKRLEKRNEDLEKALESKRVSENEPELATRLKAVEFETLSMEKRARMIESLEGIRAGLIALGPLYTRAEELHTVKLIARDGRFYPETIEVPAGERFKLVIINEGRGAEEFESIELKKEKVLAPGATSFLVFAPLKPGIYVFFGEFHPDTAKGRIVAK
jgi:Cupredoxin-like domain